MNHKTNLHALLFVISLLLITTSCGGNKTAQNGNENTDTLQSTASVVTEKAVEVLPDTTYPSINKVNYRIEKYAGHSDSLIDNLTNVYAQAQGIYTFRGDLNRQANYGGKVTGRPDTIIIDWEFRTASNPPNFKQGKWGGGTGWTGQPLFVKWPAEKLNTFRTSGLIKEDFCGEEIIIGSLCHTVYFIDFQTGKASRQPIDVGNPIKGTPSLDPTLNGNLYVGQGIPDKSPFGNLVIDLNQGKVSRQFSRDAKAQRGWGAFDSSPVRVGQFLFWPGENGTIYKYLCTDGDLVPHTALRYTCGGAAPGIESSIAVYKNYGFTGDNHGNVLCINLNTMQPVWHFNNGDDTDATIIMAEEKGKPYIYTCCEVNRINNNLAYLRKLNALNGELVWELSSPGKRYENNKKYFDGGYYATPLLGRGNCEHLIFCNRVNNLKGQDGDFIAVDRTTGEIAYTIRLKHYAWSSPVGLENENGEYFIFTGDTVGNVYLIDGKNGKILYTQHVGMNFESSPIVIGNQIVVGSRGNTIYKMTIQ